MKGLILKDLILSRILLIAFAVMICGNLLLFSDAASPFTTMFVPAFSGLFLYVYPSIVETPIKYNELELTFPIAKRDVVCSKYIEIAVIIFFAMIFAFIVYSHANNVSTEDEIFFALDRFNYFPVIPCIVLLLLSVAAPLSFRFGLFGALPLILVPVIIPALIIPTIMLSVIIDPGTILSKIPIILLIVAVAAYVASFFVSLRIMENKNSSNMKKVGE
jgi:hypothetical protein